LDKNKAVRSSGKTDKETAIIHAALKSYTTYGIAHTTMRQIAELAGIGKSTIFEYFKSKEELLHASFQYLMERMEEGHRQIHQLAQKDPVSALSAYFDSATRTALHEPATLLLISQYSLGFLLKADQFETAKEQYNEKMHAVMQNLTDEFRFIIVSGIEKNVFRPAEDITTEGLVYVICALIREIQAQTFLQDQDKLSHTCSIIKQTALRLLGVVHISE